MKLINLSYIALIFLIFGNNCKNSPKDQQADLKTTKSNSTLSSNSDQGTDQLPIIEDDSLALSLASMSNVLQGAIFVNEDSREVVGYLLIEEQTSQEELNLTNQETKSINWSLYLPDGYEFVEAKNKGLPVDQHKTVETIDKTEFTKAKLGEGSIGIVFLVKSQEDNRLYALKIFKEQSTAKQVGSFFKGLFAGGVMDDITEEKVMAKHLNKAQVLSGDKKIRVKSLEGRSDIILKTVLNGPLLKKVVEDGGFTDSTEEGRIKQHKMRELLLALAQPDEKGLYRSFGDLNASNFMWIEEEKRWILFDSKVPAAKTSGADAFFEMIKTFEASVLRDPNATIEQARRFAGIGGRSMPNYTGTDDVRYKDMKGFIATLYTTSRRLSGEIPAQTADAPYKTSISTPRTPSTPRLPDMELKELKTPDAEKPPEVKKYEEIKIRDDYMPSKIKIP